MFVAPGSTSLARRKIRCRDKDGQSPSEAEPLRQDALELFKKVSAFENAPLRPFGGGDHLFGRLTEKGLGHADIGVEKKPSFAVAKFANGLVNRGLIDAFFPNQSARGVGLALPLGLNQFVAAAVGRGGRDLLQFLIEPWDAAWRLGAFA